MDLKEKLKYYQSDKSQKISEKSHHYEEIARVLGGQLLEADRLPIIKIEKFEEYTWTIPSHQDYVKTSVHIPLLTKNQFTDHISLNDILIFDLETTGLAGGTGTYPFLIGFGEFEEKGLRIVQYFLPDYGREISAFLDFREMTKRKKILLSYNGKSYDYPLIRNRFILNRIENSLEHYTHLDLLHLARRLWKNSLPSCSLTSIEENILYFSRWQDIDGGLIPQEFFNFLQTGHTIQMERIICHNQQDIVSLARLLLRLHAIENSIYADVWSKTELVTMLDIAISLSDLDRVEPILEKLAMEVQSIPAHILINYSRLLKRFKRWDQARSIWEHLLDNGAAILFACEELAKFYEHQKNIYTLAIEYVNRALKYLDLMQEIESITDGENIRNRFIHRLTRLECKLQASS